MPYKFKGKRDCKQSDGTKGKYLTVKKDGSRRCYKSEKQYKAAQAWAHEADSLDEIWLEDLFASDVKEGNKMKITKRQLRRIIKEERAKLREGRMDELEIQLIDEIVDLLIERGAIRTPISDGRVYQHALDYIRNAIIPNLEGIAIGYE